MNSTPKKIFSGLLMVIAVFGTLLIGSPALAHEGSQGGHDDQYNNGYNQTRYFSEREVLREGISNGYLQGFRHGRADQNRNQSFNFWHDNVYRQASQGYQNHYRFFTTYQRGFRNGYELGYKDAYYGRAFRRNLVRGNGYDNGHGYGYGYGRDRYND